MKKALILLIFLVLEVQAVQDSYITVDTKGGGMCFAIDDYSNSVCNGSVITVDGTRDSILYIVPKAEVTSSDNITAQFEYVAFTPLNFFLGFTMFIGFMIGVLIVFISIGMILAGFAGIGGKK